MILDGKALAKKVLAEVKAEIDELRIVPRLAVIQVGDDPASTKYVQNKEKDGKKCGIKVDTYHYDENAMVYDIIGAINEISQDHDGIILQLPLPERIRRYTQKIINAIPPDKDVDGLTQYNMGQLMLEQPCLRPCTPMGIMRIFEEYSIDLHGKTIAMFGKSNLVGKPLTLMLEYAGATVSLINSKTYEHDKMLYGAESDIIISAVGQANFVDRYCCNPNLTILIDVGINFDENGKMVGDCSPEFAEKFYMYTPVPGGVGPMTRAYLMKNTLEAYKVQHGV